MAEPRPPQSPPPQQGEQEQPRQHRAQHSLPQKKQILLRHQELEERLGSAAPGDVDGPPPVDNDTRPLIQTPGEAGSGGSSRSGTRSTSLWAKRPRTQADDEEQEGGEEETKEMETELESKDGAIWRLEWEKIELKRQLAAVHKKNSEQGAKIQALEESLASSRRELVNCKADQESARRKYHSVASAEAGRERRVLRLESEVAEQSKMLQDLRVELRLREDAGETLPEWEREEGQRQHRRPVNRLAETFMAVAARRARLLGFKQDQVRFLEAKAGRDEAEKRDLEDRVRRLEGYVSFLQGEDARQKAAAKGWEDAARERLRRERRARKEAERAAERHQGKIRYLEEMVFHASRWVYTINMSLFLPIMTISRKII